MEKAKKRIKTSTLVFYIIYLLLIWAFFLGLDPILGALKNWLVKYEASQPGVKCEQIFDELFSDPDWAQIYTLAGGQDTKFENKDTYAAWMEAKIGSDKLTYSETSAGLSKDKKYIVSHGDEKVATFTMTSKAHEETEIVDWRLGTVEIFFKRTQSLTIRTVPGYTVALNGVVLDDSYITQTVFTKAEEYLPEGLHGYRTVELQAEGFLMQPQVTVTAPDGTQIEVENLGNDNHRVYAHPIPRQESSQEEMDRVLAATKAYCQFMIRAIDKYTFANYFDSSTALFTGLVETDPWMQSYKSYTMGDSLLSGYYRYSDSYYSVRIDTTLFVTRPNGSVKEYPVSTTLFMELKDGKWLVTNMTNVDIQERTTLVRLTLKNGEETLSSEMVDASIRQLTLPIPEAPAGQKFSGWFTETLDEKGNKTMTLVFAPSEDGIVNLPEDTDLTSMVLHAVFERN